MFERTLLFLRSNRALEWRAVAYERMSRWDRFLAWHPLGGLVAAAAGAALGLIGWLIGTLMSPVAAVIMAFVLGAAPLLAWAHTFFCLRPGPRPLAPETDRWAHYPFASDADYQDELSKQMP